MENPANRPGNQSLAKIEQNLLAAEEAYADADARWKKAQVEREEALQRINDHQDEIDELLRALRKRSVPGTKWHSGDHEDDTLEVSLDDIAGDAAMDDDADETAPLLTSEEAESTLAENFRRLRRASTRQQDDPVLKIAYGSKA